MTAPAYGYAHRGRVLRDGGAAGSYIVEIPSLAPGCASGPFQSTVRDLVAGDRVLLVQVGLTGGDLIIMGRLPERDPDVTLPINISDVTGLQTALDNRATDAELAALAASTSAEFVTVDGRLDEHDTDIAALQAVDVTLDGRLDTAETNIATNTTDIGTNTSAITAVQGVNTTQDTRLTAIETWSREHDHQEFDSFGDIFSAFPRILGTNVRTVTNNVGYYWITRARIATTATRVRVIVATAGTAGNCTGMLLRSSTLTGTYSTIGSATNNLQTTGVRDFTFTGVAIAPGDYLMAFFVGGGYSAGPQLSAQQNTVRNTPSVSPIWGTKAGLLAPPATIAPTDGTWTTDNAPWWIAVA